MRLEKKSNPRKGMERWIIPMVAAVLFTGALLAVLWLTLPFGQQTSQGSAITPSQSDAIDDTTASVPTDGTHITDPTTSPSTNLTTEPTLSSEPDNDEQQTRPTEPEYVKPPTLVTTAPEQLLICEDIGLFSGAFVEDGSDEPVENVAALLITNGSSQYLDLAKLTYDIDGREAVFLVTGLPAGTSAWVLEHSRMTASAQSQFHHKDTVTSFRENAVTTLEGVELEFNGTMLKVTNTTDKTFQELTIYYKVFHDDGNYLGGIAYMVTFGDLAPGQSAEKIAGHFHLEKAQIVRIGYVE